MMNFRSKLSRLTLLLLLGFSVMSCEKDDDASVSETDEMDIVDVALATPGFDSLVVALTEAESVSLFQGDESGPFTVFAPTNEAFVSLLSTLGHDRISQIDGDLLKSVLNYHVVSGTVMSTDLTDGMLVKTLQGNTFTVNTSGGVTIDVNASDKMGVSVTQPNVAASNGVIHVINTVLVPDLPSTTPKDDIIEIALDNGFDSLAVALTKADLVATFQGDDSGPFTVFAPTNQAVINLLAFLGLNSISEIPDATLTAVLQAHVVDGVFQSSQIADGKSISTLGGAPISFSTSNGPTLSSKSAPSSNVTVSSASTPSSNVTTPDFWATNGVIHIIDAVLVP